MALREDLIKAVLPAVIIDLGARDDPSIESVKRALGVSAETPYDWKIHWPQYVAMRTLAYVDAMLGAMMDGDHQKNVDREYWRTQGRGDFAKGLGLQDYPIEADRAAWQEGWLSAHEETNGK